MTASNDRRDIDRLEALDRAATPGPWQVGYGYTDRGGLYTSIEAADGVTEVLGENSPTDADAALIAAMRNALPHLLEVAKLARQVIAELDGPGETGYATEAALRAALSKMEQQ